MSVQQFGGKKLTEKGNVGKVQALEIYQIRADESSLFRFVLKCTFTKRHNL